MIVRTRISATAMAYIQQASAQSSMPQSITVAIDDLVRLTDEPWCSVFHHFTEK
jgi:hypothetical protein